MNQRSDTAPPPDAVPYRQIRASYTDTTIRVYQAFSDAIAEPALAAGTFRPPFKLERMTWIKPSFLWMMYRAGWGYKDAGQRRILAIDILRSGFDWALQHAVLSTHGPLDPAQWQQRKRSAPVRIQWDPERNLKLAPLPYRSIQVGLSGRAARLYVESWIQGISEITALAHQIHACVQARDLDQATALLPMNRCINRRSMTRAASACEHSSTTPSTELPPDIRAGRLRAHTCICSRASRTTKS